MLNWVLEEAASSYDEKLFRFVVKNIYLFHEFLSEQHKKVEYKFFFLSSLTLSSHSYLFGMKDETFFSPHTYFHLLQKFIYHLCVFDIDFIYSKRVIFIHFLHFFTQRLTFLILYLFMFADMWIFHNISLHVM